MRYFGQTVFHTNLILALASTFPGRKMPLQNFRLFPIVEILTRLYPVRILRKLPYVLPNITAIAIKIEAQWH